jgi:hypothetical protein
VCAPFLQSLELNSGWTHSDGCCMSKPASKRKLAAIVTPRNYSGLLGGISALLESARRASARTVNAWMTATYWEIGRRIVEFEQGGEKRAGYGEELLARLADDLTKHLGRGFSRQNLQRFRQFYLAQPYEKICSTLLSKSSQIQKRAGISSKSPDSPSQPPKSTALSIRSTLSSNLEPRSRIRRTTSGKSSGLPFALDDLARAFPLPWSQYVLLIGRSRSPEAFAFCTGFNPERILQSESFFAREKARRS